MCHLSKASSVGTIFWTKYGACGRGDRQLRDRFLVLSCSCRWLVIRGDDGPQLAVKVHLDKHFEDMIDAYQSPPIQAHATINARSLIPHRTTRDAMEVGGYIVRILSHYHLFQVFSYTQTPKDLTVIQIPYISEEREHFRSSYSNTYFPARLCCPNTLPDTTTQPSYSTPTILSIPSVEGCQLPHPMSNLRPVTHSSVSPNPVFCAAKPGSYFPAELLADLPEKTYPCPTPNSSTPYQQSITSSGGSDWFPTFTHFPRIRPQTSNLFQASLFHLLLPLALPQYDFSRSARVPKPVIENDCTPIRNTQPLSHRLIVSNLPAISGDIAKQTAEATLEHLSETGIGPNDQSAFFESNKVGYPTGLSDPPQSRYKALDTDYFEIIGPENDIQYTTPEIAGRLEMMNRCGSGCVLRIGVQLFSMKGFGTIAEREKSYCGRASGSRRWKSEAWKRWFTPIFHPPPRLPAPEGRWCKLATIASTSEVCYSIFYWNAHHFRMQRLRPYSGKVPECRNQVTSAR
ncbi:BQ5605_C010g06102 [Microbotryum silenes-dioicae]|uniref:BQ5605_C010g06102 protein n=1 Tax=Microbotryum silenes-dioicae TaxID=796604 RepID=A0A2X0MBP5_9BASI|nr:BQ5605_C010g06102 [Microbotryum silenes-dioicae]